MPIQQQMALGPSRANMPAVYMYAHFRNDVTRSVTLIVIVMQLRGKGSTADQLNNATQTVCDRTTATC